jgi:hypothetical protein
MKSARFLMTYTLLIIGCSNSEQKTTSEATLESLNHQQSQGSETPREIPLPKSLEVTLTEFERPSTLKEFTDEFKKRFSADPLAAFLQLAYLNEATDEQKIEYLKTLQRSFIRQSDGAIGKLVSDDDIDLKSVEDQEATGNYRAYFPYNSRDVDELAKLTIQPEALYVMEIGAHVGNGLQLHSYHAVGTHNGRFYFCTLKH